MLSDVQKPPLTNRRYSVFVNFFQVLLIVVQWFLLQYTCIILFIHWLFTDCLMN